MPTFPWRGHDVELVTGVDDLDLDDADLLEEEFGLDLRDFGQIPPRRQLRILALISVRRIDPSAKPADVGGVKLQALSRAMTAAVPAEPDPAPARPPVELTGTVSIPLVVTGGEPDGGEVLSPTSAGSVPSLPA